jgi:hypothetical protein
MPDCNFTVVGVGKDGLLPALPNLQVLGKVTHEELEGAFCQPQVLHATFNK